MINFLNDYHFDLKDFDLIVPVPLHPWRLYKRGFNQSLLLADLISAHLGIPISSNNLIRGHYTKNQAKISKKERWTNIQGAFKIKSSCEFVDKNILIIDDLMTTGATTSEIARVLKGAGAQKVCVLTPAITMKTD
ncbi:MAG: ComF family protein [Candidatus Omnitrophica bacterium]|nr:ComF family protein [Candidatus Omnitrophota bacterium]